MPVCTVGLSVPCRLRGPHTTPGYSPGGGCAPQGKWGMSGSAGGWQEQGSPASVGRMWLGMPLAGHSQALRQRAPCPNGRGAVTERPWAGIATEMREPHFHPILHVFLNAPNNLQSKVSPQKSHFLCVCHCFNQTPSSRVPDEQMSSIW